LWPILRAFARRMLPDSGDADDAAQQALLRVFARASELDREREALPWVVAITTNECRTLRNQRLRRRETGLDDVDPQAPADAPEREHLTAAAMELLGELSAEDIATIRGAWFGEARPEVMPATFRKRVQRATARLRELWRFRHGAL
jgi:DNA-directed RNA polymerase specialized sigma24 family protein